MRRPRTASMHSQGVALGGEDSAEGAAVFRMNNR